MHLQKKEKIIELTAEENKRQSQNSYGITHACATQADELASKLHAEHFKFWIFRILHGSSTPISESFLQHHVVSVHPINQNPMSAFILDTWNGGEKDISGTTTVEEWKHGKYRFEHYEEKSNQEQTDEMNYDTKLFRQRLANKKKEGILSDND